jgi:hypothetical protein
MKLPSPRRRSAQFNYGWNQFEPAGTNNNPLGRAEIRLSILGSEDLWRGLQTCSKAHAPDLANHAPRQ